MKGEKIQNGKDVWLALARQNEEQRRNLLLSEPIVLLESQNCGLHTNVVEAAEVMKKPIIELRQNFNE